MNIKVRVCIFIQTSFSLFYFAVDARAGPDDNDGGGGGDDSAVSTTICSCYTFEIFGF